MAPIRQKNELAKIQNDSEIRQDHLLSQDIRATPIKTTRSFINQFSNSDRKARKPHEEHVDQAIRDQFSGMLGKEKKLMIFQGGNTQDQAIFIKEDTHEEQPILSQLTNKYDSQHPISGSQLLSAKTGIANDAPPRGFDFGGSN